MPHCCIATLVQILLPVLRSSVTCMSILRFTMLAESGHPCAAALGFTASCYAQVCGVLLAVPYVVTRGLLPHVLGRLLSAEALQAVFLYGWFVEALLAASVLLSAQLRRGFVMLHNTLRDEKYLVGRELRNYTQDEAVPAAAAAL